jgi:integrase
MAIQNYCMKCKTSCSTDMKKCPNPNCGIEFGRGNRKYRVCVSVKGRRINRIVDTLTLARETEATISGDMVRGQYDIQKHVRCPTLAEVWVRYLPWAEEHKKSWRNDRGYYGKHIEPRFAKKRLDDISPIDIERMKSEMKKSLNRYGSPYSAATIKHQIVIIRRLFNLARKWGLYDGKNPVASVAIPRLDNMVTEFLTEEQLSTLIDTLDNWPFRETAQIIKFAIYSGFRRGEIFRLTWDDIDFERGMITLKEPKGGKSETIPVSPEALGVLREVDVTDSPLVFPGEKGEKRKSIKGPWKRIKKAAGLPDDFRFHGLRHSWASWMVSNGVDLAVVQKLMTHKSASTTQRYAHLMPGAMKEAAIKSGVILKPKSKRDPVVKLVK